MANMLVVNIFGKCVIGEYFLAKVWQQILQGQIFGNKYFVGIYFGGIFLLANIFVASISVIIILVVIILGQIFWLQMFKWQIFWWYMFWWQIFKKNTQMEKCFGCNHFGDKNSIGNYRQVCKLANILWQNILERYISDYKYVSGKQFSLLMFKWQMYILLIKLGHMKRQAQRETGKPMEDHIMVKPKLLK